MSHRVTIALAALLGLLVGAGPAHASTTIASEQRPTTISAYGGRVVWSHYDPATQQYFMMSRYKGKERTLPIAPRSVPFDVDLGPRANGRVVAVYSRCKTEPTGATETGAPLWIREGREMTVVAKGCDVYLFDFRRGKERKTDAASGGNVSEFMPSFWKGMLAFVRVNPNARRSRFRRPRVIVSRAFGRRSSRTVPGARRERARWGPDPFNPAGIDLYGNQVAVAWSDGSADNMLRLATIGGSRSRLIGYSLYVGGDFKRHIASPMFDRGWLYYLETLHFDFLGRATYRRYRPQDGARWRTLGPSHLISAAHTDRLTFYVQAADLSDTSGNVCRFYNEERDERFDHGTCSVGQAGRVKFDRKLTSIPEGLPEPRP